MNRKREKSVNLISGVFFAFFLMFFPFPAYSAIVNGDFEMSEPNALGALPVGWTTKNYARVHESFTPVFERGQQVTWSFLNNTVLPATGSKFLVLSTGDIGPDSATTHAIASQLVTFKKGETLRGKYFFGTGDYLGWNDWAEIRLKPADPNSGRTILVKYVDVQEVGDYSSTDGWQMFSHKFNAYDQGEYHLECIVSDRTDAIYKSYLMIDSVESSRIPPDADFNADGKIDYLDLAVFASVLYQDCTDPNSTCTYIDAGGNEVSFDFNNDQMITPADMEPLGDNWLWKP